MVLKILRLFTVIFVTVHISQVNTYSYYCDASNDAMVNEGNLGQTNIFNWLGVLRVILYNDEKIPEIAMTGVVLVKREYALVNAHDVSRIPLPLLRENGRVQFFPTSDISWSCKPKTYTAHPEYGPISLNTVALLQLDLDNDDGEYSLKPICWTSNAINASTFLYAAGYTDENKILEKVIYKLQYTDNDSCTEFYNRAKLGERNLEPVYYLCGHAVSSKSQCVWDNGMVLISNATQYFTLLGFGIRGPGCAAPARFINLQYYHDWMEEVTSDRDEYEDYRRDGGFEEVPLHELFNTQPQRREDNNVKKPLHLQSSYYPFDTGSPIYFNVDMADRDSIAVFPFNDTWESFDKACSSWRTLMYREHFVLHAQGRTGNAVFKVSLYDLLINKCTCIKVVTNVETHSSTVLSIKEQIDLMEGEAISSSEEMIPNLFMTYPFKELYPEEPNQENNTKWEPGKNLKPNFLQHFFGPKNITNYNLYITFEIKNKATINIEVYGEPYAPGVTFTTTTTTPKARLLRLMEEEEESAELQDQKTIKAYRVKDRDSYRRNKVPDIPMFKSGFVKEIDDTDSPSLYGVIKRQYKATTTVKTTEEPKHHRPLNLAPNNFSHQLISRFRPIEFRKTLPPSFRKTAKPAPVSTRRKYDKVHMYSRVLTTTTPIPNSQVQTLTDSAQSPKSIVVFRVTFAKILCFDIIMLLINS